MKVVYADEALDNLDGALAYIASNYPAISAAFEKRLHTVITRPPFVAISKEAASVARQRLPVS